MMYKNVEKLQIQTIADLRRYLETLPSLPKDYKIAVGSLIFTQDDKVILLERGDGARDAQGKLEGVGGSVDEGETDLSEALRREIREEINVEVEICEVLTVKVMEGARFSHWVVVDYLCRLKSGSPSIQEHGKIRRIHYLSLKEIVDEQLSEYQKVAMGAYLKKYGGIPFYKI